MENIKFCNIKNELGQASITYGNNSQRVAMLDYDFPPDDYDNLPSYQKKRVDRYAKTLPQKFISLNTWYATEPKNGFGRYVINKLFDIGEETNMKVFSIFAPSEMANAVIKHYVDIGVLTPFVEKRNTAKNTYYYYMNHRPLNKNTGDMKFENGGNTQKGFIYSIGGL